MSLKAASARRAQQCAHLAAQKAGPIEAKPDRPPAQRGVFFLDIPHVRQHLVAADIERAERDRFLSGGIENRAIESELFAGARQSGRDHELQFSPKKPDAGRAGILDMRQVDGEPGIDHQRNFLAVLGDARTVAQRPILRLPARAQFDPLAIGRLDVLRRTHMHVAGRAVDDDGVARLDQAGGILDFADGRNAERARHDRDVRGRPAFLQHQAAQPLAVVVEQRRRAHGARDDDRVFRQLLFGRGVILAHQHAHQPVGEIIKVVQAVAQIMIGGAQHARARIGLHAFDAGFRGEAGHDGFANLCSQPWSYENMR